MRLIDGDEMVKAINKYERHLTLIAKRRFKAGERAIIEDIRNIAKKMSTVDPVKHGRWDMRSDPYGFFDEIPVCSECGCTTKMRETYRYCPNCGAKNDEVGTCG